MIKEVAGSDLAPRYGTERKGDVKHSLASIEKAKKMLGYQPSISLANGLGRTFNWYKEHKI